MGGASPAGPRLHPLLGSALQLRAHAPVIVQRTTKRIGNFKFGGIEQFGRAAARFSECGYMSAAHAEQQIRFAPGQGLRQLTRAVLAQIQADLSRGSLRMLACL